MSYKIWTADELADHQFRERYLIEPVVPQGGIIFLSGKRGIGKTLFCLTLAACLEQRGLLFGLYPVHPSGTVVYVQADTPAPIQQERVLKARDTGYSLSNVHFLFPKFFNIMAFGPQSPLVDEINALAPCLIIWDTLRKIHHGSSNEDDAPSRIYGQVQALFPSATHLFIHHEKKTVVDQEKLDVEELFRGSGAWLDDADTGYRISEVASGRLLLENTKHRTCEEQAPISLTLNRESLLLYASAERMDGLLRRYQGPPESLEDYLLSSFVGSPRYVREVVERGLTPELSLR